jgi:hypothetical protein
MDDHKKLLLNAKQLEYYYKHKKQLTYYYENKEKRLNYMKDYRKKTKKNIKNQKPNIKFKIVHGIFFIDFD